MPDGVNFNVAGKKVELKQSVIAGAEAAKAVGVKSENVPVAKLAPGEVEYGGVRFAKGVLKPGVPIKTEEHREKNADGTFKTYTTYTATLVDGTVVTFSKQPPINQNDGVIPSVKKNKDGSFDFTGLQNAKINDTPKDDMYYLLGCQFTSVNIERGKDKDVIEIGNIRDANGKLHESADIRVRYNKGDKVGTPMQPVSEKEYNGVIGVRDGQYELQTDSIGYGRNKVTVTKKEWDSKGNDEIITDTPTYYSHAGIELKESYVNAKEQTLADGYRIRTSQDGKEQWFYAPDGKLISKETFRNRGL
ncbi:MAG: hypothetical protein NC390_02925 [Fusobacterium sp.]|nr:hypothetical protein [Fusobacterium sp.]